MFGSLLPPMMFTVYILYSKSLDRYYIGHTGDMRDRLHRHNSGRSKSTRSGLPWELAYQEEFSVKSQAYRRELEIKAKKSRIYIKKLIEG